MGCFKAPSDARYQHPPWSAARWWCLRRLVLHGTSNLPRPSLIPSVRTAKWWVLSLGFGVKGSARFFIPPWAFVPARFATICCHQVLVSEAPGSSRNFKSIQAFLPSSAPLDEQIPPGPSFFPLRCVVLPSGGGGPEAPAGLLRTQPRDLHLPVPAGAAHAPSDRRLAGLLLARPRRRLQPGDEGLLRQLPGGRCDREP